MLEAESSKAPHGVTPYAITSGNVNISGSEAIALHLARMNPGSGLIGNGPFHEAKIDQWLTWASSSWNQSCKKALDAIYQGQNA